MAPPEIMDKLKIITDPYPFNRSTLESSKIFVGKLKVNEFKISKVFSTYNANRPVIVGKIYNNKTNSGSIIELKFRTRKTFILYYLVGAIIISAVVLSWFYQNNDSIYIFVFVLMQLIWFVFLSIMGTIFFYLDYKKSKRTIEQLLTEKTAYNIA